MKEKQAFQINRYLDLAGLIVALEVGTWSVFIANVKSAGFHHYR